MPIQETIDDSGRTAAIVRTLRRDDGGRRRLFTSLAYAPHARADGQLDQVFPGAHRIDLPTYTFQHHPYWLPAPVNGGDVTAVGLSPAEHPLLGATAELPDGGRLYTGRLWMDRRPWLPDHAVLDTVLLPGTAFVELAVRACAHTGRLRHCWRS